MKEREQKEIKAGQTAQKKYNSTDMLIVVLGRELKKEFRQFCKVNGINSSLLIRNYVTFLLDSNGRENKAQTVNFRS